MQIKCLAQGSGGNCWVLTHNDEKLIIDAGIPDKEIIRGINYDLLNCSGVIVTHSHKDHSLSCDKLEQYGLNVFKPYESTGKLERQFGCFNIKAFEVEHDGTKCYGFIVTVDDTKLMYVTDFEYCKYRFASLKIKHLIVECNYQFKYINQDLKNYGHKLLGHCELETCKKFIQESILTNRLSTVILTHLGASNCDGNEIVDEVSKIVPTGVLVDYARANETYILGE